MKNEELLEAKLQLHGCVVSRYSQVVVVAVELGLVAISTCKLIHRR